MVEFLHPNIGGNVMAAFSQGRQMRTQEDALARERQANMLAGQAFTAATPEAQQQFTNELAGVDADSAFAVQDKLQGITDKRMSKVYQAATQMDLAMKSKDPNRIQGTWRAMVPFLKREFPEGQFPDTFDEATMAPVVYQALAMGAPAALSGAGVPTGVREFDMMTANMSPEDREKARRVQLGIDGRASSAGYTALKFKDDKGRERVGSFNGRTGQIDLPDGTSFDPRTQTYNTTMPEEPAAPAAGVTASTQMGGSSPSFGIAETDNYVRSILGKAGPIDPNAPPEQIAAQLLPHVIQQESGGNPNAVSPKGAQGLMQIMPDTGRNPGFGVTPMANNSPEENVRFGKDYLVAMLKRYPGQPALALAAYNGGYGVADRFANATASRSNNPGTFTGRTPEEEAAAVKQAELDVQLQNSPRTAQAEADAARLKKEAEVRAERTGKVEGKAMDAMSVIELLDAAEPLLADDKGTATGGAFGYGADLAMGLFGKSTGGAERTAALRTISGQLTAKQPRMEGPQSNIDVAMYKEMAGDLANPLLPVASRLAAARQLRALSQKYADQNGPQAQQPAPQAPAQASPVRVRSAQDYDGLPSGAIYIAPDGSQRRKR